MAAARKSTPPTQQTQNSLYIRYALGAAGGLGLLLGTIAVFATANGIGAFALLLVGAAFLVVSATGRIPQPGEVFAGRATEANAALLDLLRSTDAGVRLAAAEAVLEQGPAAGSPGQADTRDAALGVLLERDLTRRLMDLLAQAGYQVESGGNAVPLSDVVVRITGPQGSQPLPIEIRTGKASDSPQSIQQLGMKAHKFGAGAALVVHAGTQAGESPLGSTSAVGDVQVLTVYSPRLADEQEIVNAVVRAQALLFAPPIEPVGQVEVAQQPAAGRAGSAPQQATEQPESSEASAAEADQVKRLDHPPAPMDLPNG